MGGLIGTKGVSYPTGNFRPWKKKTVQIIRAAARSDHRGRKHLISGTAERGREANEN